MKTILILIAMVIILMNYRSTAYGQSAVKDVNAKIEAELW